MKSNKTLPASHVAIVRSETTVAEAMHAMLEQQTQSAIVIDDEQILGTIYMKDLLPLAARMAMQTEKDLRQANELIEQNRALALAATDAARQHLKQATNTMGLSEDQYKQTIKSAEDTMTALSDALHQQLETNLVKENIDLATFLTKLASALHDNARVRGVFLNVTSMPETIIFANPKMLGQTLRHLLQGAINRSPEGSLITITGNLEPSSYERGRSQSMRIRAKVSFPTGHTVMLSEPHIAHQIITALARNLRRKHEGLSLTLPQDSDTIFTLGVPIMKTPNQNLENFAAAKVLVVEDDPDILDMLKNIIQEKGFHVICAHQGEEALELFKREQPCLVLADIRMPVLDGIALAEAVKSLNPNTPVILISGQYPNLMTDKLDHKLKCDHVLYKPFASADIIESLNLFLAEPAPK